MCSFVKPKHTIVTSKKQRFFLVEKTVDTKNRGVYTKSQTSTPFGFLTEEKTQKRTFWCRRVFFVIKNLTFLRQKSPETTWILF